MDLGGDISLSPCCVEALERLGFRSLTPVQSATIPYFMRNKDVAVEAVTGSGKTLAFVIPVVEMLLRRPGVWPRTETGALVVLPTRELARQVAGVFQTFLPPSLSLALLIGGKNTQTDIHIMNTVGAHVVVGTPGRLADLLSRTECSLASSVRALEVLVLDEADRLLEMGFKESITTILSYLPKQRRTGLFSATLTQDIQGLISAGLRNPVTITVRDKSTCTDPSPTPHSLENYYLVCGAQEKFPQLAALLTEFKHKKVIVFFATCASVSYFSLLVMRLVPALQVMALHGKMHRKRQKFFAKFSAMKSGVLMCTDVMARGVDFPAVNWVIQFDPPSSAKAFVHRCGRTARMGQAGKALVLLMPSEEAYVEFLRLNQHISLLPFSPAPPPLPELLDQARELAAKEREVYELGPRAFVSFVHFYYKHESKLIFRAKELDLMALARGFALLHLPRMPELRARDTSLFRTHPVDPAAIPYRSRARERLRLARLQQQGRKAVKAKHKPPWKAKKVAEKKGPRKRQRQEFSEAELEELGREARLLKKFKAGKISKAELEAQLDADPA